MSRRRRRFLVLPVALALVALVIAQTATGASASPRRGHHGRSFAISTVSNPRPSLVSGGEVLLRVTPPRLQLGRLRVRLDGRDVSRAFRRQSDGTLLGLVTGLRNGTNTVTARSGFRRVSLRITNHPISGPVFSGRQQLPFFCETTAYGLPAATQPDCSAPTQVSYLYKSIAGGFKPLADPTSRPSDLAQATVEGRSVPYVVRLETGTIDRAVYQTAVLSDVASPSPLERTRGWNGRLVYTFGGGCNGGYHQGSTTGGVINDLFLSQGYGVASSSLNVLDNNCSTIISAEAAMMVKEHFIDTFGPVRHTIGWGGSGGAIQQYDIADQYPGILDGIVPGISFPDPVTTLGPVADCRLLNRYFDGAGSALSIAERTAVAGFLDYTTCRSWDLTFASRITATDSCSPAVPADARWNAVTNPDGVRCAALEQYANQLGRDKRTGFVRSTLDNVGVQYGLGALEKGLLSPARFATLNASIGGYDYTGKPVPQRSEADRKALRAAYADDIVNSARQGLASTPIIDQRTDLDQAGLGNDIHTSDWSYVMRARLIKANGSAANQVIIASQPTADQVAASYVYELGAMDRWLTAIGNDHSRRGARAKVIADKPADLGDGCYLSASQRILEPLTNPATGRCGALYPVGSNTQLVAGQKASQDVLKCRLRPLRWSAYPVAFTRAEKRQLRLAFPTGVCDYDRRGVGQQRPRGTWLTY